jgi:lipopolysaccharide transport system ATP-binding protein
LPTASDDVAIEFNSVTKAFRAREGNTLQEFLPALARGRGWRPPFRAVNDLSFFVNRGETLGIVGRNGCGKTTVLRLIAGSMVPDSGSIEVSGRVCPLIELGAGFSGDLTGYENIYLNASILGLSNAEIREALPRIVEFSELEQFMDLPVKRYSSGMYVRLAFSVAVFSAPDILLIDEALAVGDAEFQEKSLAKMREIQARGVTCIFVSHDMNMIESFCTRAMMLDAGRRVAEGTPAEVAVKYHEGLLRPTATAAVHGNGVPAGRA